MRFIRFMRKWPLFVLDSVSMKENSSSIDAAIVGLMNSYGQQRKSHSAVQLHDSYYEIYRSNRFPVPSAIIH